MGERDLTEEEVKQAKELAEKQAAEEAAAKEAKRQRILAQQKEARRSAYCTLLALPQTLWLTGCCICLACSCASLAQNAWKRWVS